MKDYSEHELEEIENELTDIIYEKTKPMTKQSKESLLDMIIDSLTGMIEDIK